MPWASVQALAHAGAAFGSHTQAHQILTSIPFHDVQSELGDSRQALQSRLSKPCHLFAYPNGNCSQEVRVLVAQAGYQLAFTVEEGVWTRDADPLLIPRLNIS
jgi:peptidoglycan/xylan/chitin deacetylase (PgdA/CDA1 family)